MRKKDKNLKPSPDPSPEPLEGSVPPTEPSSVEPVQTGESFDPAEEGPPANAGPTESVDTIASFVQEQAPKPNETAMAEIKKKRKESGRGAGQDGKKRGPYKGKRGEPVGPEEKEKFARCYQAGADTIDALVTMGAGFMGPVWDWAPPIEKTFVFQGQSKKITFDERVKGHEAFGNLYARYGWEAPSPLMAVAFFAIGYAGRRLKDPEVREQAKGFMQRVKLKIAEWKIKREQRKIQRPVKPIENPDQTPQTKA